MVGKCTLCVRQWAAIRVGESEEVFGCAGAEAIIPAAFRRRMGKLERLAVRCTLGLLAGGTTARIIFCSRYGNIETLGAMFGSIAAGEAISPMAFSGSVHNAAAGLIAQIRNERIAHTALAAGANTFKAGLVEAYAALATENCRDVVVCFADLLLPELYQPYEVEHQLGLALAIRVTPAAGDETGITVRAGRVGALEVLTQLQQGESTFLVRGEEWLVPQ